ncbi:MAG: hypothetical protein IKD47_03725 [Clostridia bacterium]|nr:hypothetical protein [Clostridia bacterium]
MDVMQDVTMEEKKISENESVEKATKKVALPFPKEDYKPNGKLKRVRGRVLKKLLKYEFKYILPALLACVGLLTVFAFFFGLETRVEMTDSNRGLYITAMLLYLFGNFAVLAVAIALPSERYAKNFFKGEGYVTFSIPATIEEHLLAKRITAITSYLIGSVAVALDFLLAVALSGEWWGIDSVGIQWTFEGVLVTLEVLAFAILGLVFLPTLIGAGECFVQKFSKKQQFLLGLGIVFGGSTLLEIVLVTFLSSDLFYFFALTTTRIHILVWLIILLETGLLALTLRYEYRYLKYKLNLK